MSNVESAVVPVALLCNEGRIEALVPGLVGLRRGGSGGGVVSREVWTEGSALSELITRV